MLCLLVVTDNCAKLFINYFVAVRRYNLVRLVRGVSLRSSIRELFDFFTNLMVFQSLAEILQHLYALLNNEHGLFHLTRGLAYFDECLVHLGTPQ